MKGKFSLVWRVVVALVLVLSFSLVAAVPAAAAVDSVSITAPTTNEPAYAKPGGTFTVKCTVNTGAVGWGDVEILLGTTVIYGPEAQYFAISDGSGNDLEIDVAVPPDQAEAMYNLMAKARQPSSQEWIDSDFQTKAVVVDATPPVVPADTLTRPNGGEGWKIKSQYNITWEHTLITDANSLVNPITLEYSTDSGTTWKEIATGQVNEGTYSWSPVTGPASDYCLVRITAVDQAGNTASDESDAVFTIFAIDTSLPLVNLDTPADGIEASPTCISGSEYAVKTKAETKDDESGIASVKFEYSADEGATWNLIGTTTTSTDGDVYEVVWDTTALANGTIVWVKATATNGVGATNSDTHDYIMVDNSAPSVTLTAPLDSAFIAGASYAVEATASDGESGVASVLFEYKLVAGAWTSIDTDDTPDAEGVYEVSWNTTSLNKTDVLVKATATNGVALEAADTNSGITIDNTPPLVDATTLTSPDGGEGWKVGSTHDITWDDTKITDDNLEDAPISLYYKVDGGYMLIASDLLNSGTYSWTVAGPPNISCKVKLEVVDKAGNTKSDESGATFTMYATDTTAPTVSLTAPVADETIMGTYTVKATATDGESGISQVVFAYSLDEGETWTQIIIDEFPPAGGGDLYTFDWDTSVLNETGVQLRATATNGIGMTNESIVMGITVEAAVWVDDDADDSWYDATHLHLIQDAINHVVAGGTVNVADGIYTEDLAINKAGLTLKSETGKANTTIQLTGNVKPGIDIQGGADGFTLGGASDAGFTILGPAAAAAGSFLIQLPNAPSNVEISYNTIDTTGPASQGISVGAAGASSLTITHNIFIADEGGVYQDVPISLNGPVTNLTVTYNEITGSGIPNKYGGAIDIDKAMSGGTITNNTISGFDRGIMTGSGDALVATLDISHNDISGCGWGILFRGSAVNMATVTVTENNIHDNTLYGIQNITNAIETVTAKNNWWGDASGPYHATTNSDGLGDPVSDAVDYSLWLNAAYPDGVPCTVVSLEAGWNLISLPLIPTDDDIDTVLADLKTAKNVEQVRTFESDLSEKWWIPDASASTLSQVVDGQGYWIEMSEAGSLTATGVDFALPGELPTTYDVVVGWNLIGFTSTSEKDLLTYLGAVDDTIQAIYGYAEGAYFIPGTTGHLKLEPGHGYWLAVSKAGTIYP